MLKYSSPGGTYCLWAEAGHTCAIFFCVPAPEEHTCVGPRVLQEQYKQAQ